MADTVVLDGGERHFITVWNDFWDIDPKILSCYDKLVLIGIKRHANQYGESFPSIGTLSAEIGISQSQVKRSKKKLTELGLIQVTQRQRKGSYKKGEVTSKFISNEYHIRDTERICKAKTAEEMKEAAHMSDRDFWMSQFVKEGLILPEVYEGHKKRASDVGAFDSSDKDSIYKEDTITENKNQEYSFDFIYRKYDYDALIYDLPSDRGVIDTIMEILYELLNRQQSTMIDGQLRTRNVIMSQLDKLDSNMIKSVISKFNAESEVSDIKNVDAYLSTMLYREVRTHGASVQSQYKHNNP